MNILRNVFGCIVGVVLGGSINMALVVLSPLVIPPPAGVDVTRALLAHLDTDKKSAQGYNGLWQSGVAGNTGSKMRVSDERPRPFEPRSAENPGRWKRMCQ